MSASPSLGAGWLWQFAGADTLEYDGVSFSGSNSGRHYFMPSVSLKGGMEFSLNQDDNISMAAGMRSFWQYPFNDQWLIHPAVEVELRYQFGGGAAE